MEDVDAKAIHPRAEAPPLKVLHSRCLAQRKLPEVPPWQREAGLLQETFRSVRDEQNAHPGPEAHLHAEMIRPWGGLGGDPVVRSGGAAPIWHTQLPDTQAAHVSPWPPHREHGIWPQVGELLTRDLPRQGLSRDCAGMRGAPATHDPRLHGRHRGPERRKHRLEA